ncbi:hypothetical protein PC116_g30461 [Phytophthora cactorum]|nr:hypothetical protein PC116_g30461 [Phytophthora cactorum]
MVGGAIFWIAVVIVMLIFTLLRIIVVLGVVFIMNLIVISAKHFTDPALSAV